MLVLVAHFLHFYDGMLLTMGLLPGVSVRLRTGQKPLRSVLSALCSRDAERATFPFQNQHRRRAPILIPSLVLTGFFTPRDPLFSPFSHFPAPTKPPSFCTFCSKWRIPRSCPCLLPNSETGEYPIRGGRKAGTKGETSECREGGSRRVEGLSAQKRSRK